MTSEEFEIWLNRLECTIEEVRQERKHQYNKWGVAKHDNGTWLKILVEEVGELAKAMLEISNQYDIRKEAYQVAAVALAIAQCSKYGES